MFSPFCLLWSNLYEGNTDLSKAIRNEKLFWAVLLCFLLVSSMVEIVNEGERTVVTRFSKFNRILPPGLNFTIPIAENTHTYNVRVQKNEYNVVSAAEDSLRIGAQINVQWRYNIDRLEDSYRLYGSQEDLETRIEGPIQQLAKEVMSEFPAENVIPKRAAMAAIMLENLQTSLQEQYFIHIERTDIADISLPDSLVRSIEEKKVADQNANAEKNRLRQHEYKAQQAVKTAEAEATARIIAAQAEAEALLVEAEAKAEANAKISKSLTPILIKNRQVESWDGALPKVMDDADLLLQGGSVIQ